jgi:hypothetical protein
MGESVGLDPPFLLYFPRLVWRTFLRLLRLEPQCSPGCVERPSEVFFSKESIVLWCITNHSTVRARFQPRLRAAQTGVGTQEELNIGRKMRRIGGWGGEFNKWLRSVREMVGAKVAE